MGMSKARSLMYLRSMGLNTPFIEVSEYPHDRLLGIIRNFPLSRISIRSYSRGKIVCPFNPFKSKDEQIEWLASKGEESGIYEMEEILVSEGIDPRDSSLRGKITKDLIEWNTGPGTVRDMETESPLDFRTVFFNNIPSDLKDEDKWVFDIQRSCAPIFRMYPASVVEWSIYPYPIGILGRLTIYWEVTNVVEPC